MKIGLKVKSVTVGLFVSVLAGCASVPLDPGAQNVVFTTTSLPKSCQSLGQVSSTDVNGVTTSYTSHANLQMMEINTLKNQALALGANVVVLTGHRTVHGRGFARREIKTHTLTGNAYVCPASVLSTLPDMNSANISDIRVKY